MTVPIKLALVLLFWGAWPILTMIATQRSAPHVALLIGFLAGAVAVFPMALGEVRANPVGSSGLAASVAAGLAFTVGMALFYQLISTAAVSTVTVVSGLYPMVTVLLAWAFLGEAMSPARLLGVVMALGAIVLLTRG